MREYVVSVIDVAGRHHQETQQIWYRIDPVEHILAETHLIDNSAEIFFARIYGAAGQLLSNGPSDRSQWKLTSAC